MVWPMLAPLSDEDVSALVASTRRRTFAKGEVVFHEGDPADSMHLVDSGHLAVRVSTPDGERATLNILSAGDIFGELALLDPTRPRQRSATVVALDAVVTRSLSVAAFTTLCRDNPGVKNLLATMMADRIRLLGERLLESMYLSADRRLYRCLVDLSRMYAEPQAAGPIIIPLTQDHLADLVGATRPSVNQILQRLAQAGIVEVGRGRVSVHQPAALAAKAGVR